MALAVKYFRFLSVAALVVVADQVSKGLVLAKMPLGKIVPVIPGLFNLHHVHNRGGAFGFLAENDSPLRHWVFVGAAILALISILYFHHQTPRTHPYLAFGLSLIFGGAIGNFIDRLRLGEVVDFLDFHIASSHWPTFNVADSAVVLGVGIFVIHMVYRKMPF